jgi:hypothetical protein
MIMISDMIQGTFFIVCALVALLFPLYLLLVIVRTIRAWRMKSRGPSKGLVAYYLLVLFVAIVFTPLFGPYIPPRSYEAKSNLMEIFNAQIAYFGMHDTFAGGADSFILLEWSPKGPNKYAYYCGDYGIANSYGPKVPFENASEWPMTERPRTDAESFTCGAIGNIDEDGFPDIWIINDSKELKNIV